DDHELFRRGIIGLLQERGIHVAGEASLAADAIRQVVELAQCVVLMDLNMPGMSGVEATQRLTAAAPLARVLLLTMMADDDHAKDALLAGAWGYMLKDAWIAQIVEGIEAAARGESVISSRVATRLVRRIREPQEIEPRLPGPEMTQRELEVLELVS